MARRTDKLKAPIRAVVEEVSWTRSLGGKKPCDFAKFKAMYVLECGHTIVANRPKTGKPKKRVHCDACAVGHIHD
jgi:hypothetical protein